MALCVLEGNAGQDKEADVDHQTSDSLEDQTRDRLQQEPELPFSRCLPADVVRQALAELGVEFRQRVFDPLVTLWAFLSQVLSSDHSCREAVARVLAWRSSQGLPPCSPDDSSYCQARSRLPLALLQQLVRQTATVDSTPSAWLWKGRQVKIADGTTVLMADTPANQAQFPQSSGQAPGLGFPIARLMVVFSLAQATVLDLALAPLRGKQTGENTLFRQLLGVFDPGDLLLGDRLFDSYHDLALLRARGVDALLRMNGSRRCDFRRGRWLGRQDHLVCWRRPRFHPQRFERAAYDRLPAELWVRELRFHVEPQGFRPRQITLVTTLLDAQRDSAEELAGLYRQRWHCELDLRSLKTTLQMNHLRCKTPEMVRKELWTHLLAYNLIRQTMAEAACRHQVLPRQLSFKGAVQLVHAFAPHGTTPLSAARWTELLRAIAHHRVGDRPNRVEPRKIKRRRAKYPYLTTPRHPSSTCFRGCA